MNVWDLFAAHVEALRDFSNEGKGKFVKSRLVALFGFPFAVFAIALILDLSSSSLSDSLLAGYALFAGVLIAAFTQLAGWRNTLDARAKDRLISEAPARRAVSAAVAHSLYGVLVCLLALVVTTVNESLTRPPGWLEALSLSAASYVIVVVFLIVQALFVGYAAMVDRDVENADEEILRSP